MNEFNIPNNIIQTLPVNVSLRIPLAADDRRLAEDVSRHPFRTRTRHTLLEYNGQRLPETTHNTARSVDGRAHYARMRISAEGQPTAYTNLYLSVCVPPRR